MGDLSWESFKAAQSGWVKEAHVQGAKHYAFSDFSAWKKVLSWPSSTDIWLGSMDGKRFTDLQRRYVRDFADWVLWGKPGLLVKGIVKPFSEVTFIE